MSYRRPVLHIDRERPPITTLAFAVRVGSVGFVFTPLVIYVRHTENSNAIRAERLADLTRQPPFTEAA